VTEAPIRLVGIGTRFSPGTRHIRRRWVSSWIGAFLPGGGMPRLIAGMVMVLTVQTAGAGFDEGLAAAQRGTMRLP
jgi:hypothetical protein